MYYKECPELTFGLWNSAINSLGDVTKYGNWRGGSLGREAGKSRLKTELRSVGRNPFTFFCIWPNQQKDSPTGKFFFFFFPLREKSFPWAWVPRVLGWDAWGFSGELTAMNYRGCSWSGTGSRMELRSREQEWRWNHSSPTPELWRGAPGTLTVISTGFLTPRALGKSSCAFCSSPFPGF